MKILITSAHSFEGERSSALIVRSLAKEISKKHQVLYLRLDKKFGTRKISKNLTYLNIPCLNINNIFIPQLTPGIRKKVINEIKGFKPDIIHGENIIYGALLSLIWGTENHVPFVLTFHSPPQEGMVYMYPNIKTNKLLSDLDFIFTKTYISIFLKRVDRVIALNQFIVDGLKIIHPSTKYTVIDNGLYLDKFKSLEVSPPKDTVEFIYPGLYIGRKNQAYLIEAFRFLPDNYVLNLYGNIKTGYFYVKKLKEIVKNKNIKNVKINDYLEEKDLVKAYAKSQYLVSASVKEVQSLVIIEALAAGKPIIALENETTKDILKGNLNLVISQSESPKIFAKKLVQFVRATNKKYNSSSLECRKMSDRFDIKNTSAKTIQVYEQVLKDANELKKEDGTLILKIFLEVSEIVAVLEVLIANFIKFSSKLSLSSRK